MNARVCSHPLFLQFLKSDCSEPMSSPSGLLGGVSVPSLPLPPRSGSEGPLSVKHGGSGAVSHHQQGTVLWVRKL